VTTEIVTNLVFVRKLFGSVFHTTRSLSRVVSTSDNR